ncbi:hypothetical protein FQZ97_933060 [compost metagenome]
MASTVRTASGTGSEASISWLILPSRMTMWACRRPKLLTTVPLAMTSSGVWDIVVLLIGKIVFGEAGLSGRAWLIRD